MKRFTFTVVYVEDGPAGVFECWSWSNVSAWRYLGWQLKLGTGEQPAILSIRCEVDA